MPAKRLNGSFLLLALFVAAAFLYTLHAPLSWVGDINDDACYVSLAQSLLQKHYQSLATPGQPPHTVYPPVFPALLAPFVAVFQPHWMWLKIVPIGLTLLTGLFLWRLSGLWLSLRWRLWALAFFLFNPAIIRQTGLVMSDAALLACLLAALDRSRSLLERHQVSDEVLLGVLLGCGALIRMAGFALIPPFLVMLWWGGRRRAVAITGVTAVSLGSTFIWRNLRIADTATAYAPNWLTSIQDLLHPLHFLDHFNRLVNLFFVNGFLGLRLPYSPMGIAVNIVVACGIGMVMASAFRTSSRQSAPARILLWTLLMILVAWTAMHSLWKTIENHYAIPLQPLIAILTVIGIQDLIGRSTNGRIAGFILSALISGSMLFGGANLLASEREALRQPTRCFPARTWSWARLSLPPNARFLSAMDWQVYLYTRRECVGILFSQDADEFRDALLALGVTHILTRPRMLQMPGRDLGGMWARNQEWAAVHPFFYREVFRCDEEATVVYEVIPSTGFRSAYALYRHGRLALAHGHTKEGLDILENALRLDPALVSALNAYGAACLLSGERLDRGNQYLERAVQVAPRHALAWWNLSRIRRARHDARGADEALARARLLAEQSVEWKWLQPIIS